MKKKFYLWMFILVCDNCFAQVSSNEEDLSQYDTKQSSACGGVAQIFKEIGSWKREPENDLVFADKTFPANQYNGLLVRIEKVLPIMKEALPDLGGLEPRWKGSIRGNSFIDNGPVPSSIDCLVFTYYCNNNVNKVLLGDEASAVCTINFNGYGKSFCQEIYRWDTHGDGKMISIYQLPAAIGKWKGITVYEPKSAAVNPGLPKDRAVVIGHNGQMPWHVLSQKQYLTGYKNWLLKNKKEQLESSDTYIRQMKQNIADIQASKGLSPEAKKNTLQKLEKALEDFKNNTMQKTLSVSEKIYDVAVKPVNQYLDTATTETLAQPANLDEHSTMFKGYFAKQGEPGIKLISFTPKYFNMALPRYVPQFMVLYWRWNMGEPSSRKFGKEMEENFPVEKLNALLDK